jgi:hypothetical protein
VPVRPRRISEFKPILGNLAQSSHYLVQFGGLPIDGGLSSYLASRGIDRRFILENAGLLCYSASLPTSSLGTFTTDGNHMGVRENFAHSRVYTSIQLDFYIDRDYKMLNFLEGWMEYISSGNRAISQTQDSYFVRMQYPRSYKIDTVRIFKFDRDYRREIEYNFKGFFPENISSVPVTYMNSDVLKVSASFLYDRYIAGKSNSVNEFVRRDNNNLNPTLQPNTLSSSDSQLSAEELLAITQQRQSVIFSSNPNQINQPLSRQANSGAVITERRTV